MKLLNEKAENLNLRHRHQVQMIRYNSSMNYEDKAAVKIRRFPYPYEAAIAICSDIDETKDTDEFLEIQKFLNTKKMTSMGEGVGLEIGNSFYFYDDKQHFSYFNHDERAQGLIIDLVHEGYMDCLHTYGDAAYSRDQILRALDHLTSKNCRLKVWVNHYNAPSNFGSKFKYMFNHCLGDDPRSNVYHTDLSIEYGIRFAWLGAITRVIGQESKHSKYGVFTPFDSKYPVRSSLSVLKEIRKVVLGLWADDRYIMQSKKQLIRPFRLQDGQQVHEFARHCNHPANVSLGATSKGLAYVISEHAMERLKRAQGYMIAYTHFGKNSDCRQVISKETQWALKNLEHEYRTGNIFVTTTSKLLNYCLASQNLVWSYEPLNNYMQIKIDCLEDPIFGRQSLTPNQIQGITFYVPEAKKTHVFLHGKKINNLQRNPVDHTKTESVTIPINYLRYPF